mmetsp:Transcript_69584/g.201653  ORF Transcript_69584/g.201653 Transcript_69584/m.201653 type:complete len:248 (-) Transcript_69584:174-917(-)
MRHHHGLGHARGTGGVDQGRTVAWLHKSNPIVHLRLAAPGVAELEHGLPAEPRDSAAPLQLEPFAGRRLRPISNERLEALAIAPLGQGPDERVQLVAVVHDDDGTAGVHHLVGRGVGPVRGVETRALAAGVHGPESCDAPLGRVEAPDVHGLEGLHAEGNEGLRRSAHVDVVVLQRPRRPLLPGQSGRNAPIVTQRREGTLCEQGRLVALQVGGLGQQRHQRGLRTCWTRKPALRHPRDDRLLRVAD